VRRRLLVGTLFMLSLPLLCSTQDAWNAAGPYQFTTLAGHTQAGDWCQCGSGGGCTCDPGDLPLAPVNVAHKAGAGAVEAGSHRAGTGADLAMLVLALLVLTRMLL
jgi:hypothetical protein